MSDTEDTKPGEPPAPSDIRPVSILDEMKRSYLDYAMSVIVARALPDARDGLKPVHRRILYAMYENGFEWNKPYRKSARTVGDVIGKYHPHGDQSVYDAMVRMAQDFSMRVPLIDGQGNFGSVDGDMAAAMRYTESRLTKIAQSLIDDIDKDTVDFQGNYDNSEQEPRVLPAKFPNLLVNGAGGIAVGMATNIPPHNLGEVIDACVALIDDPALGIDDLINIIPGPDFPTGGIILGRQGIRSAYHLGRGSIVMRGKVSIEPARKDREAIIISEIPYQVNKATMVERIAELVRDKKIEGISDLRDESDRDGFRVVIELKRDAVPEVVLNQLYKFTPLQSNFSANVVALDAGRPQVMNLKDLLDAVHRLPRTGGVAAHQIPAQQGARPRPYPGRPCHCGRQYRRDHSRDPHLAGSQHRAGNPDVARLAGQGRGGDDHANRRSPSSSRRRRHRAAVDGAGQGHSRSAPAAADRAWARGNFRRARQARSWRSPTISTYCARARASRASSRPNCPR